MMVTGTVVRFDDIRGYGFISPDGGGEDVFIHANDLMVDKRLIGPGVQVEFFVEDADRGLKASRVRIARDESVGQRPAPEPAAVVVATPASSDDEDELCDVLMEKEFFAEVTEILLNSAPGLTAEHIVAIRRNLVEAAARHGWIEK